MEFERSWQLLVAPVKNADIAILEKVAQKRGWLRPCLGCQDAGSKLAKAESLGIPVLDEAGLQRLIAQGKKSR